jgi:hypothetical protein
MKILFTLRIPIFSMKKYFFHEDRTKIFMKTVICTYFVYIMDLYVHTCTLRLY